MKIFMYSDVHICKTSSILPHTEGIYSYRQKMIMETGKWLESIIDEHRPDLIVNLGDTFDQHTITSYDIDTAYEFFKCFRMFNIPHIVLVGNHEMINQEFNAVKILNNINNITVISEPCTINTNLLTTVRHSDADLSNVSTNEDIKLAFLPYCNFRDIRFLPEGDILFSHMDIQGSQIRENVKLEEGLTKNQLSKYKLVFNGHIHKPSISDSVINVGSITTHSFSDDENSFPTCYIYNSETNDLQQFFSTICPLFRKIEISNLETLQSYLNNLNRKYNYCINCICPFEIKDEVKRLLEIDKNIISTRINVKMRINENKNERSLDLNIQTSMEIEKTFSEFLTSEKIDLKYPLKYYKDVISQL